MGLSSSLPEDNSAKASVVEECECYDVDEEPECLETKDLMKEYAIDEAVLKGFKDSVRSIVESREKIEGLSDELSTIERADASATATSNKLKAANYKRDGEGMFIMDGDQCLTFTDGAVAFSKCSLSNNQLFEMKDGEVRKGDLCIASDGTLSSTGCASFAVDSTENRLIMENGKSLRAGIVKKSRRTIELFEAGEQCPEGYVSLDVKYHKKNTMYGAVISEEHMTDEFYQKKKITEDFVRPARQSARGLSNYVTQLRNGIYAPRKRATIMCGGSKLKTGKIYRPRRFNPYGYADRSVSSCKIYTYPYEYTANYENDSERLHTRMMRNGELWNKVALNNDDSFGTTRVIESFDPQNRTVSDESPVVKTFGMLTMDVPRRMCEKPTAYAVDVVETDEGNRFNYGKFLTDNSGDYCDAIKRKTRPFTDDENTLFTSSLWLAETINYKRKSTEPCSISKNIEDKYQQPCTKYNDTMHCFQSNVDVEIAVLCNDNDDTSSSYCYKCTKKECTKTEWVGILN